MEASEEPVSERTQPPLAQSLPQLASLSGNVRTFVTLLAADLYVRLPLRKLARDPVVNVEAAGSLRTRQVRLRLRDGTRISCRLNDLGALSSIYLDGDYKVSESHLRDALTIVDVGAHIGSFTLWASRRSPESRILALEPNPDSFYYLPENVSANGLRERVRLIGGAIGGRPGFGELIGLSTPLGTHVRATETPQSSSAKIYSLQNIFEIADFDHCNILKMDCEGAEFDAILQAPDSLLKSIDMIMCEYHPVEGRSPNDLSDRLERCGFEVTVQQTTIGMLWATRQ